MTADHVQEFACRVDANDAIMARSTGSKARLLEIEELIPELIRGRENEGGFQLSRCGINLQEEIPQMTGQFRAKSHI